MDRIFQRILEDNLADLAGLTVDASIPIPEKLVNEVIAVALQGNKNITYCRVSIERQNHVDVELKTSFWPWPLALKLKLFKSADLAGAPKIRAFLENKVLLGKLGSLFGALPEGVKIYDNQVAVDIGFFLKDSDYLRFLELIKAVEINTDMGKLILNVKIER
jgi:hypothetical protein